MATETYYPDLTYYLERLPLVMKRFGTDLQEYTYKNQPEKQLDTAQVSWPLLPARTDGSERTSPTGDRNSKTAPRHSRSSC